MFSSELLLSLPQKLSQIVAGTPLLFAELCLAMGFLLVLLLDLIFRQRGAKVLYFFTLLGFVGIFVYLCFTPPASEQVFFLGLLRLSAAVWVFKLIVLAASIFTMLILPNSIFFKEKSLPLGELYALLWAATLGLCLLLMSANLLMVYLSLELISISSYLLTAFGLQKQSAEGSIKYLLIGSLSSGIMLYGMSLLYGFTGTLDFGSDAFALGLSEANNTALMVAILLSLGGLFFKISIVPFHIWIPDVYEATPSPIVAFFSTAPKIAALFLLYELSRIGFQLPEDTFGTHFSLQEVFALLAILTITLGNFSALWQQNLKRLLAYSSIAQAGFLMIVLLTASELGMQSFVFYSVVYLLMNFAAFLMIEMYAQTASIPDYTLQGLQGKGRIRYGLAASFTLVSVSLVGLPPTAGFTAKLLIFSALWETYLVEKSSILLFLFIYGLFNAALSLFYYLKIPYYLFLKPRQEITDDNSRVLKFKLFDQFLLIVFILPLLLLFFRPDLLLNLLHFIF